MKGILLIIIGSFLFTVSSFRTTAQQGVLEEQFDCALTDEQVAKTPEALRHDSLVIAKLGDIDPKYAEEYSRKSRKEKLEMVNHLVNYVFPTGTDIFLPENTKYLDFLKLYDFRIPSIHDADLTGIVCQDLRREFGISLRISAIPPAKQIHAPECIWYENA